MPAPIDGRDGLRVAKVFREHRVGLEVRACDLDSVCASLEIDLIDSALGDPGYTACLQRCSDGLGGLIALKPGQDRGRRRFSIGHELGHYCIPKHRKVEGYCADRDMRARLSDAARQEWEANDFATELLMPRKLFTQDARRLDVTIASAVTLSTSEFYDVSVTAAAWRMIQTTRESAAIVVSSGGRVEWIYRSDAFRLPITERGQAVHANTLAADTLRDGKAIPSAKEVDAASWLDYPVEVRGTLLESTHFIPSLDQTVSLLWLVDGDTELGDGRD
jgi:hypothetical protein